MIFTFQTDDLEILQGIVEESSEHLNGIEEGILRLENDFEPELLDSIFRAMHSVKGVASFVDFVPIKDTAHSLESFLTDLKKGLYPCSAEVTDLLLRGVDTLNLLLQQLAVYLQELELQPGQESFEMTVEEHSFPELIKQVDDLRKVLTSGGEPAIPVSEIAEHCPEEATNQQAAVEKLMKLELSPLFDQMLLDFMEETSEHLEDIEAKCVLMEKSSDPEVLNAIMRGFHSIKGGAGVISSMHEEGVQDALVQTIKNLTHGCESLLQTFRNQAIKPGTEVIDLILTVVDKVVFLTANLQNEEAIDPDVEYLLERIKKMAPEANESGIENPAQGGSSALPQQMAAFMNISGQAMESIKGLIDTIEPDTPINKKRIKQYSRALKSIESTARYLEYEELVQEVAQTLTYLSGFVPGVDVVSEDLTNKLNKSFEQMKHLLELKLNHVKSMLENVPLEYGEKRLGEILLEENKLTPEQLQKALDQQKKLGDILLLDGSVKAQDVDLALAKQAAAREKTREVTSDGKTAAEAAGQSIRVSQEKLDRLMNMIGELIISKNQIHHLAQTIANEAVIPGMAREAKAVAGELARISDELQDAIMSARMVPLKVLFQRYPRTIRDTSRKAGKQVELIIEGEDIELDKTVIEAINDPLVHMLRNAVDHGLESPDERRRLGKPATGTVRLRAYYQGTYAVIEISDDGKGLNPDEIKFKAVKKGLIRSSQIEEMSNDEALQLIFSPGFSTRDEVSELSGRGVGMDVVKTNTEKIGGLINLDSKVGEGTTFSLKIPLSMSIIRGLMVESRGHHFVIPLDSIEETVKITRTGIRSYKQRMVADVRGEILPLYELGEVLNLENEGIDRQTADKVPVVVINSDGYKYGLIIDAFQKEQEFVVKALAEEMATLKIYNGASILGDGSVVLILNCTQLL
ncbi:MAG: chemotaxis protein CheA [Syntrophomonadaceae bacterium]|nr:chemotaxis protein CheA [Syntrophomonadaceae bacterium]